MKQRFKVLNLSQDFMEHFNGLMLGDGHLTNKRKSPHSSSLEVKNKYADYIGHLSNIFEKEGIEHKTYECYKGSFEGSGRCFEIETKFYPVFSEMESLWYVDGVRRRKTVPESVELKPNTILQWFLGDGYVVRLKRTPVRVMFCTDRYSAESIEYLRNMFFEEYRIDTQMADRNRIRIPRKMMSNFYEVLPKCPVDSLQYKWI